MANVGRMMRRWSRSWAGIAALIAASPVAAAEHRPTAPVVIALEPYLDGQWAFHARLGDQDGLFLFDTGGGTTVLTPAATKFAGCEPWGRITGFRMRGDRLDLKRCDVVRLRAHDLDLVAPVVGVFDLMALMPKTAPVLLGSISLDAFSGEVVTMDLAHRRLIVETPQSAARRIRGAREVPVHFGREVEGLALTPFIAVQTKNGLAWMEVDSGSDGGAIIGQHLASAIGMDPAISAAQDVHLAIPGGVRFDGRAIMRDLIYDGNIGTRILQRWIVTIDLVRARMWIADAASGGAP